MLVVLEHFTTGLLLLLNMLYLIGGALESHEEVDKSRSTSHELRRTRFELVLKEYEVNLNFLTC